MVPSQTEYAIPVGSLVLITGANGYIGSQLAESLLERGFNIRGTVREEKPWLNEYFDTKFGSGRFETVIVPKLDKLEAFDDVLSGVSAVAHVATDVSWSTDPEKIVPYVRQATTSMLESAAKHASVKRVVLTSSTSAALIPVPNKEVEIGDDTWNDYAVRAASEGKGNSTPEQAFLVYAASKTEGEKAAWEWISNHKPHFVFNTVLPNYTLGKILVPGKIFGSTMGFVNAILHGDSSAIENFPPQLYVSVKDVAAIHIAALLDKTVIGERIYALADHFTWTEILTIIGKLRPHAALPAPIENEGRDLTVVTTKSRSDDLLRKFTGRDWIGLEECLAEGLSDK